MNELLAVAIPTYNRCQYLAKTLENILPQVAPHQIPIYVSDNGSSDDTLKMLAQFKKDRYPLLFYKTVPVNLGIDQNIVSTVAMASSRYVWLFGDDDLFCAGAINRVLKSLNNGYALIVVNGASYNFDFSLKVEERRIKILSDKIYEPSAHEELLADTASYLTFLGGMVVHKQWWELIPFQPYIGSDYVHVAIAYRYIVGHKALLLADPLIQIRLGQASWAKRYFEVELIHWPRAVWGLPCEYYSDRTKRKVCQQSPTHSIRRMLATRAYGYYGRAEYEKYIQPDTTLSSVKKILIFLLIYLPQGLAKWGLIGFKGLQRLWGKPNFQLTSYRLST